MPPYETLVASAVTSALFHLEVEGAPGPLFVARVTGREAVSELFELPPHAGQRR